MRCSDNFCDWEPGRPPDRPVRTWSCREEATHVYEQGGRLFPVCAGCAAHFASSGARPMDASDEARIAAQEVMSS